MCNYWTNFARTGDPNGADADGQAMPRWPAAGRDGDRFMLFGEKPAAREEQVDALMLLELAKATVDVKPDG